MSDAVRCSVWTREAGVDPVGSIGSYRGFLLVEWPLPWPRDAGQVEAVAALSELLDGRGIRVQLIVPRPEDEARRLVLYSFEGEWFSGYRRHEAAADAGLRPAVEALLSERSPEAPEAGGAPPEILVCTHGRRDVCCGSAGTELAMTLAASGTAGAAVRRTSHTGGHRFAPTFVHLPTGSGWAFADEALVAAVCTRSIPFAEVAAHYRGCAGLETPGLQALERQVLVEQGWEVMDLPRRGVDHGDGRVTLEVEGRGRWEAEVRPGRSLPVPECMQPLSAAKKTSTEWTVGTLRRTAQ